MALIFLRAIAIVQQGGVSPVRAWRNRGGRAVHPPDSPWCRRGEQLARGPRISRRSPPAGARSRPRVARARTKAPILRIVAAIYRPTLARELSVGCHGSLSSD